MKKVNFIAYDPDAYDFETFEHEKDAEKWIDDCFDGFIESEGGYSEAVPNGGYVIAKVIKRSKYEVIEEKKDYTNEEWEEMGYSQDFELIGNAKIVSCIDPIEEIKSLISLVDIGSWWDSLSYSKKQDLSNLVFRQDLDWLYLGRTSITDREKKLIYFYSKIL